MRFRLSVLFFILLATPAWAQASTYHVIKPEIICAGLTAGKIPTFTEPECRKTNRHTVDPQGRFLWIKGTTTIPADLIKSDRPLGLFISGKASSRIYMNGHLVGSNGVPSNRPEGETPGQIDSVAYLPREVLKPGHNEIMFALSGHHSKFTLPAPITTLVIGPYSDPTDYVLRRYIWSLPLLGVLLLGTFFFGKLAHQQLGNRNAFLLPLASLFAAGQLVSETSRAFINYPYPFHDARLSAIIAFAFASGVCLLVHTVQRFTPNRAPDMLLGGLGLTVAAVYFTESYDAKAGAAIMVPAAVGGVIALIAATRGQNQAKLYSAALFLAAAGIYLTTSDFLDVYYYYVVGGLIYCLFMAQIRTFAKAQAKQAEERARADRLQHALDKSREKIAPTGLSIKSAGSIEMISTDQLVFCKGARDYVELAIMNDAQKLHSGSLNELEEQLPTTFLRVHRSYLVNTGFIEKLERDSTGTGKLLLSTGDIVPVSRRIMPQVRKALL